MLLLQLILAVIAVILTVALVIGVHELGHYASARFFKIKVLRFCLGLGKPLYIYRNNKGTEFAVTALPLGGYVKLLDERETLVDESERHLAFNRQALWKRTVVILCGP